MQDFPESRHEFRVGQRVHASGDSRRIGTVKYVGPVEGYSDTWVGVDWDNGEGKHDGSINGVRYFHAKSERSGLEALERRSYDTKEDRAQNLSQGISLLEALERRYRSNSTKDEEDEMYVLSTSNKRVSVQLLGKNKINDKLSRFEELTIASLSYMGVSSPGIPCHINATVPNIKELNLSGNLLSEWKMQDFPESRHEFRVGQRVHASGDSRRIGTVKYVGPVEGYSDTWVGVDWDNGEGKHDGSINGVRYFHAKSERSGLEALERRSYDTKEDRAQNLSQGISLLEALERRYRSNSTKDEEDEMYVLSTSNKRVSVQLLGKNKINDKLSRFEELTIASLSYMGVSSPGIPCHINATVPNIKELNLSGNLLSEWKDFPESRHEFRVGQRVHASGDSRRIGTVKYVGPVEGYSDTWVGVDWDNGEGKHDGSINGVRYFHAKSERSGLEALERRSYDTKEDRAQNLSQGISLLEALERRYRSNSTKDEEDEMYVLSTSNKRVSVQLLGKNKINDKLSRFEELTIASLSYMGVSSPGIPCHINATVPNIKELNLSGNLLSEWKDVGTICEQLPALETLNLSNNLISPYNSELPLLKSIRVLVLNNTGVDWQQVELLRQSLARIEELHIMGNNISRILPVSSSMVQGFDSLRLLNLEDNCIAEWSEIMKLSQLRCLEQLYLNKNCLSSLFYPDNGWQYYGSEVPCCKPFQNLRGLLLGDNNISDLASVDSLNLFPNLVDIRLSGNPLTDATGGGVPRFVLIARLAKIQILNGSEITPRERKDSEIRYARLVASRLHANPEEIKQHPRFSELKNFYGIEDQKPSVGATGPQTISSGFLSITLKCVGASMGEKQPLTKKLPATTTVGKLKFLCESFFKLKSMKLKLFLQEEGSPLPLLLDNDTSSLMDLGVGNDSIILVDEES